MIFGCLTPSPQIRFLADPAAKFSQALDVAFDASAVLGNVRSKRYAITVEDGKVKEVNVEPDNIGHTGMFYSVEGTTSLG